MRKVIDAFLFFRELDLLEIRLEHLAPYVDVFIICEAGQTFSGKRKEFNFEKNIKRFSKYLHKIHYLKIEDFHESYGSIIDYQKNANSIVRNEIASSLEGHTHYPKNTLSWVLESYHRECIRIGLELIATDEDIVMISDLDEIPSLEVFYADHLDKIIEQPRVCQQHEFRYFLNYYKDSNWLGTVCSKYSHIKNSSLNILRLDSQTVRSIVNKSPIINGGYHFTSCGGIEELKLKIASWGHQEFNDSVVLNNLEENIKKGKDIFYRESGTSLRSVSILDSNFFSQRFSEILAKYPHLISQGSIDHQNSKNISDYLALLTLNLKKVKTKLLRLV